MKKRLLAILLTLAMALSLMPMTALADTADTNTNMSGFCGATDDDSVTWKLEQNNEGDEDPTYTLTISGNGAMADYSLTKNTDGDAYKYEGTDLSVMDTPWSSYALDITEVVIEAGVTHIGVRSFDPFTALTSVTIADSVTSIGNRAFEKCSALQSITLPQGITRIEDATFFSCTELKSINLNAVAVIGNNAFDGCAALKSVDLTSLTEIGNFAFQSCKALTAVTFGNGIKALPTGVFKFCSGLTSITFPDSLEAIGAYCFYETGLTSVDLNNVKTISSTYAFANCTSLQSVVMDSLEGTLPGNTFNGCTSLTKLTIPAGVTTVTASGVFAGCTALKTLTLAGDESSGNITLAQTAFSGLSGLTTLYIDRNIINNNQNLSIFKTWDSASGLDVIFGDDVTTVPKKLLEGTENTQLVNRIVFGEKVTTVDAGAFAGNNTIKMVDMTALSNAPSGISLTVMASGSVIYVSGKTAASGLIGTNQAAGQNYAKWKSGVAVLNDGSLAENTEVTLNSLATPIKDGYAFNGWYSDEAFTTKVEDNQITSSSYDYGTYYAKWAKTEEYSLEDDTNSVTLEMVCPGATAPSESVTVSYTKSAEDEGGSGSITKVETSNSAIKASHENLEVTITAAEGLSAGTYTGTVYIYTGDGATLWVDVTLTVNKHQEKEAVIENRVEATCTENGSYDEVVYCSVCNDELSRVTVTVPATGHTEGDAVKENEVPPTYTNNGSYDVVVYCTVCGEELSRETVTVPKLTVPSVTVPTYTISTPSVSNGTVSVTPKNAAKNATVTITVTPDKDYELASLTVVDANGNRVSVKQTGENKFTFTMPASKVTVNASFSKIVKELPFTDVSANDYFFDAVVWAVENGVTYGNTATTFGVGVTCNRADAVTFIWRAYGCPAPKNRENPFTDVADSAYYADAVLWAVENGITVGTSATTFSPLESCRREHIVTFLYRAAGSPTVSHSSGFADVADSAYYANAVTWAAENGITVGAGSATTFGPTQNCFREQIVTFLYRNLAE